MANGTDSVGLALSAVGDHHGAVETHRVGGGVGGEEVTGGAGQAVGVIGAFGAEGDALVAAVIESIGARRTAVDIDVVSHFADIAAIGKGAALAIGQGRAIETGTLAVGEGETRLAFVAG